MSTPQSVIYICSGVRLDSRYNHTIFFANRQQQFNYFSSKVVKQFSTYSFIRKTWSVKVAATLEEARTWSYLFFRNNPTDRYWYYFINNIEYVNDATVELTLELDVMQTYLPTLGTVEYDYKLLPCFVERNHIEYDIVGANTVEENLELGDLICNGQTNFTDVLNEDGETVDMQELCIMIMATKNPETGDRVVGSLLHGVFSGVGIYAVSRNKWESLADLLKDYDQDAILSMWMYPKNLVKLDNATWANAESTSATQLVWKVSGVYTLNVDKKKQTTLDGYKPKNNKLLTYPYNFFYVSNNNGVGTAYKYERFEGDVCEFEITGAISPDATIRMTPCQYNGAGYLNYEEGMELSNFPTCAWNADAYKIWLAQNQNQLNVAGVQAGATVAAGAVATIAGAFTGGLASIGGVGMMASGASQIANLVAQQKDMQMQPPQAMGSHSVNLNVRCERQTFTGYFKSVDEQHARIIDSYFSMYGYKINKVQMPRINVRPDYTYIKTIDCQIESNLCNEDARKIESIYDKGITFWLEGDKIGEYLNSNGELKDNKF